MEADTDRMMREYRAQLDAERARKLAQGKNHSSSKSSHKKGRCSKVLKKKKVFPVLCCLVSFLPSEGNMYLCR